MISTQEGSGSDGRMQMGDEVSSMWTSTKERKFKLTFLPSYHAKTLAPFVQEFHLWME